jgi:hypothetical protein
MKGVSKKKLLPSTAPQSGGFLVHKRYQDKPVRCNRHADLKRVLNADMTALAERAKFYGNQQDQQTVAELADAVGKLLEAGEGEVDMLADPLTGVRYVVRVEKVA